MNRDWRNARVPWPAPQKWLVGALPLILVGVLYESMTLLRAAGLSPAFVHLCDLRARELSLFGVSMHGKRVTVHDWFQAHPSALLDMLCAVPYGSFIFVCIAFGAWLCARDYERMLRFGWSFFALNVAGLVTYQLYPAAPPWYYHAHGCYLDLQAVASEGPNLARVDAHLGIPYFAEMYRRSSDVFGAMPSLHVAYPLLVVLEGWAVLRVPWRAASVGFFLLMCFAAVYLDHHWVLDVLAGAAYGLCVVGAARSIAWLRSSVHRARNLARVLATWFGCGLVPIAPGTVASAAAIPIYLVALLGGRTGVAFAAILVASVGIWAASLVARELGEKDPPLVVIDEVAGLLLTMLPVGHASPRAIAVGFLCFRVLDVVKPWPVRQVERLPSGWGIVLDDVAAGLLGGCIMAALIAVHFIAA
jgi:inositol phosphorylceramide synthase catalytic subunit